MSYYNFPTTEYFEKRIKCKDRNGITKDLVGETLHNPQRIKMQENGRISLYRFIKTEWKVLRIVVLPDGRTVHNCYWDRDQLNAKNRVHYPIPEKRTNYSKYYPHKRGYAY